MYTRTRCTLVTSVKSSALAAIREVLKKGTDNKNGLFFAEIEEYIHEK